MKWIYSAGCCSRAVPGALLWGKRVRILPKGGNLPCFPLLWCDEEHCCIWQFCKINYCSQTVEEPCSGLFMGSAVLEDSPRCTSRPVFGWARCEGEANQGPWTTQSPCTSGCPSSEGGSHQHPWLWWMLPRSRAGLAPAHPHQARWVAAFGDCITFQGGWKHLPLTALGGQDQLVVIKINHKWGWPLESFLMQTPDEKSPAQAALRAWEIRRWIKTSQFYFQRISSCSREQ